MVQPRMTCRLQRLRSVDIYESRQVVFGYIFLSAPHARLLVIISQEILLVLQKDLYEI